MVAPDPLVRCVGRNQAIRRRSNFPLGWIASGASDKVDFATLARRTRPAAASADRQIDVGHG